MGKSSTSFRPEQSGNPRGKPKGRRDNKTLEVKPEDWQHTAEALSGSVGRGRKGTDKKERSEMKRRVLFATVVSAAVVLAGATSAYAQQTTTTGTYVRRHVVTVAFPFTVGGKQLPAGKYSIEQPTRDLLIFQEEKKDGARVQAPVISRLPAPATPITESKLLFDKVGNTHYLSEVWFRGVDGFLLYGSKEAHTRVSVKIVK